ncbi:MAG TPA: OmpA family protein [Thermoanaerobaculia bacterium]
MNRKLGMFLVVAALCAFDVRAQEDAPQDVEGCVDSKLLNRLSGCVITECDRKDYDSAELFVGGDDKQQAVEGQTEIVGYDCGEKLSMLQMVRNAEAALKKAGYSVVFTGTAWDSPVVTARKGNQWMQVHGQNPGGGTFGYKLTAVRTKEMAQEMVANADVWAEEINRTGSCSIYGILFDSGKSTIQPESRKCLEEVVKLLRDNPSWKMQVEGHTDNVGAKAANKTLSEERAAAVVAWLTANGIEKARLTSKGFGDSVPVAENTTEDGRSKNRRVALKKL